MVSFEPNEEQQLIRDMAREFAQRELRPKAAERDRVGEFPLVELRKLAELGLLGVNVPESYGGSEAGSVAYALAITELAKECASTTVAVAVSNMVAEVITAYGSEEQKPAADGWQRSGGRLRSLGAPMWQRSRVADDSGDAHR